MGRDNDDRDRHGDELRSFEDRCSDYRKSESEAWAHDDARVRLDRISTRISKALAVGDSDTAIKELGLWTDFQAIRNAGAHCGGHYPRPNARSSRVGEILGLSNAILEVYRELDVHEYDVPIESAIWIRRFLADISAHEGPDDARGKAVKLCQVAGKLETWQPTLLRLLADKLRAVARRLTSLV